ncbi:DUF4178 domain-containing protein [Prolixibacteraceae bacterium]|nr:DUF4178 domain-containing protein [Prolixibacteraceae bacterium]
MGILDFLRGEKAPSYDPTNIKITDLDEGFVFDYDLQSWTVKRKSIYDWGDNSFSYEYQIFNGTKTMSLSVEEDDEVTVEISTPISITKVDDTLPQYINTHEKAPYSIQFEQKEYRLVSESPGYFQEDSNSEWEELITWRYESRDSNKLIYIDQWDDMEFEVSISYSIKPYEISNILPR